MKVSDSFDIGEMDDLGRLDTPVHRLDARAKAVATLVFIGVVMSFPRYAISSLTPFILYPVALVSLGRIPMRYLARKILIAAPFALLIGVFNPLLDREPVTAIGSVAISGGWLSFGSIMFRFLLTVGAALALVACTGMNRLGAALERLGVPRVFVVQLLFLHRYLFVVSDQAAKMKRSAVMRSSGRPLRLSVYASMIGHLLIRSMDRAERVYRAMVARGFDGEVRILRPSSFGWPDTLFVAACILFFVSARVWNLADGFGRLLTGGVL
ncbi:MAG: cobalt ECF transporter T component CbiQ [Lentisphaerae bacterium]|nr:cobalt ECF transporter T component CbiQ [Lentisphaerota bacterium]